MCLFMVVDIQMFNTGFFLLIKKGTPTLKDTKHDGPRESTGIVSLQRPQKCGLASA